MLTGSTASGSRLPNVSLLVFAVAETKPSGHCLSGSVFCWFNSALCMYSAVWRRADAECSVRIRFSPRTSREHVSQTTSSWIGFWVVFFRVDKQIFKEPARSVRQWCQNAYATVSGSGRGRLLSFATALSSSVASNGWGCGGSSAVAEYCRAALSSHSL